MAYSIGPPFPTSVPATTRQTVSKTDSVVPLVLFIILDSFRPGQSIVQTLLLRSCAGAKTPQRHVVHGATLKSKFKFSRWDAKECIMCFVCLFTSDDAEGLEQRLGIT
jgi:hypothetical protein